MMLGSSCSPCCGNACGGDKPSSDPATESRWVPIVSLYDPGTLYSESPAVHTISGWQLSEDLAERPVFYFWGSTQTSNSSGQATEIEETDWGNLCNWYSAKAHDPFASRFSYPLLTDLTKRATRLPPEDAVVIIYGRITTANTGPRIVANMIVVDGELLTGSEVATTAPIADIPIGCYFTGTLSTNYGTVNGGATFRSSRNRGVVFGNAVFSGGHNLSAATQAVIDGDAVFVAASRNAGGLVTGNAFFIQNSQNVSTTASGNTAFSANAANIGTISQNAVFLSGGNEFYSLVDGIAVFKLTARHSRGATVNGGAEFFDTAYADGNDTTVNGGAVFNGNSQNRAIINGGAVFNDDSLNTGSVTGVGTVNGGATFNNNARHASGTINGGAVFNDAACSLLVVNNKFVAHPTDLPTCNGSAIQYVNSTFFQNCGCG